MARQKRPRRERAVIYMRQSTYREESISLELQESACRAHAEREGYDVVAVEADPGITGRTWDRPAVHRVMTMIAEHSAEVIILWKWSRLSRSRKDWATAADEVEGHGGRIESATEAIDTSTSTGRLARGVMVEFAAFESERIGDVWREAHARRVASGRPANGKPRFGYAYDSAAKVHVPDPITGPILAEAYRRYLAGDSVYALVKWIRESGAEPARGYGRQTGEWNARTLRRVLDSGFAAGLIASHGELLPGIHEPLISEHEWARYLRRRDERRTRRRTERSEYLLSGLVRCSCGGAMQAGQHTTTGPRLRCREAVEHARHKGGYIQEHFVTAAVRTVIADLARDLHSQIDLASPGGTQPSRREALEAERERIYGSLTRLAMRLADETITPDVHARAAAEYDRQLASIDRDLAREQEALAAPAVRADAVIALDADWDVLPIVRRREALTELLESITVTPGDDRSITITTRLGNVRTFRP